MRSGRMEHWFYKPMPPADTQGDALAKLVPAPMRENALIILLLRTIRAVIKIKVSRCEAAEWSIFMYDKLPRALFVCSAVTCILLRVWVKLTMVDPVTGFYSAPSALITFFNLFLLVASVTLFIWTILPVPVTEVPLTVSWKSPLVKGTSFLCAAGAWAAAGHFCLILYNDFLATFNYGAASNVMILWVLGFLAKVLIFVIAPVLSGWMWVELAVRKNLEEKPLNPYLCLMPVVWQFALAVNYFMKFTAMRSVSDQQFSIATAVLAVPFLLAYARLVAGVDNSRGLRQLRPFGYVFALFALMVSTGIIAAAFAGLTVTEGLPISLGLLFYPALALHTVTVLFSTKQTRLA